MLRKYLARLLAFVLVLNLVLCAPLSAGATEVTFKEPPAQNEVDVFVPDQLTNSPDGNLVVSDEATVSADVSESVPEQSVSIELPIQGSTIDEEGGKKASYDILFSQEGENGELVVDKVEAVETDSFDITAEVTDVETTGDGQVTDITYNVSLDEKTSIVEKEEPGKVLLPEQVTKKVDIAENSAEGDYTPEYKVNMSINGMNDQEVTRVEHKYKETKDATEEKVEYYYNAKTKTNTEADNGKKFFTVVQETVENVKTSFVSLVTNFFGKFHITTDAFEGAANDKGEKVAYSDLASAVNSAAEGSTVEMLRDYITGKSAVITKSDNVTVDLNGKTYTDTDPNLKAADGSETGNAAMKLTGNNQNLTIQNGTIVSGNRGVNVTGSGNKVIVDRVTITSDQRGVQVSGSENDVTVSGTTVVAEGDVGVGDFNAKNTIKIEKSDVITTGDGSLGVFHNGSNGGADIQIIGSYVSAGGTGSWGIYVSGSNGSTTRDGKNNLTLTDSTIVGSDTGVEVKYTNVTVNNSELVGFGVPPTYVGNNNGTTTSGVALAVTDNRTFKDDGTLKGSDHTAGTITINSGYFYGHKDIDNIFVAAKLNAEDSQATIQLNGGRFVYPNGLYKYTDSTHAVISYNDGSEYPYEVVKDGTTPTRPGYTLQGYKDDKDNDITLAEAIATKAIAYAQWELIPAADTTEEAPAKTPTTEAPKDAPAIIVEADSKGNNVDVSIKDSTAVVTVSTPAGEAAAVSEVTIPSVAELQKQGVDTVEIQVEENVTLELGIADTGDTLTDSVKVTREEDTLVISSGEKSEIVIHMTELKAAATEPVRIQYNKGVLTISLSANAVYTVDLKDALAADKALTVKLEDGVLKLYDKDGNLIQEIKL